VNAASRSGSLLAFTTTICRARVRAAACASIPNGRAATPLDLGRDARARVHRRAAAGRLGRRRTAPDHLGASSPSLEQGRFLLRGVRGGRPHAKRFPRSDHRGCAVGDNPAVRRPRARHVDAGPARTFCHGPWTEKDEAATEAAERQSPAEAG
jgi:hypothetical protein